MGETVLIVEDNGLSRKLVRDVLQAKGYRTIEAATAAAGIEMAMNELPDLIVMDIQLPDFDGVTALGRLRKEQRTSHTPVLAVTAFAMREDRERFIQAGFDGYLSKPFDIREFLDQVGRHCRPQEEHGASAEDPGR
jgi:CheY-like chemotaxis protein